MIRLRRSGGGAEVAAPTRKKAKPKKPPSRARLESAEKRLADLEETQSRELGAIDRELKALTKKRDELAARHSKARKAAVQKAEAEREDYEAALAEWEG